jgi:hypothetical protein
VPLDEVPALLAQRFGIKGVALVDDRRLILRTADGA